ncbi:MAG TPA: chloride channel protein [Acidimicrobiia bacterium]|nr:chloride channel protein [Acidimicrobiia bacterium]
MTVSAFLLFTLASTATVGLTFLYYARRPGNAEAHLADLRARLVAAGPALLAVVATLLAVFTAGLTRLFTRLPVPSIAKPTLGGLVFGVIGVALPLTLFTGSDQLKSVLRDAPTLGLGLLVAIVFAKVLAFAVSNGSGFVGGPIFPALLVGGAAGIAVHHGITSLPLGLALRACSPPFPAHSQMRRSRWP